ncbi:MAG: eukaryotic-like serine/threonine-protein kinase [Solirubrobacteraceae bacterium]|jgi:DNA-binding SARP family transcriptional activator|nr:eukaryotic-like serine/threonine-protein kinase [Solirubrobacteraceae bacterium]
MDFRLLGPLEVAEHNRSVVLGGVKQRALLAVLLLHANDVVSTEQLVDDVWGESPPATVAKSIQVYVSRLRKQLGEGRLVTRAPGYLLRVDPSELDVACFERLAAEAEDAQPKVAGEKLRRALALWRGPPLADLAYEPFARAEIARLEELRAAALEQRIEADLALGRHSQLVGELEGLVREHPLRERLRGQLMLCLYRCGRQAEALESYQAARRVLVEELGIEPGRQLRELHQAILRQDPGLDLAPVAESPDEAPRGAFVGRVPELAELMAGLDDAFAGRGRLFLVVGEPGIGKSRLAEEVMRHARARGARVLVGRCWEAGGAPAYWPWVQALRAAVRDTDSAALLAHLGAGGAQLAQIVPELRQRFPDLPEPPALESEVARFRLFDATAEFLGNISQAPPTVLVLDDLHAADAPSLLLLRFLARELRSTHILLLVAYRNVDPIPGRPLTETLAEVAREPVTRRVSLGGLSEREVAQYVELTASQIASTPLVTAVHQETEGNPLFVGEIVRLLAVEGVGSESTAEARLAIPQSIRDVIARRLTHLSDECNRLLVLAAVIGREFALDALARLAGVSEDGLLDVLDEAMAARVLADVPGAADRLRFAHVLIRDTLYEGLAAARRARLHRQVVAALEALYGDEPGQHLAELAHHSIASSDVDKALRYAQRAGDRALALLAYEEAARLYQTALDALDLADVRDERTRCELLLSAGEAQMRAGNTQAAKRAFLDAAGIGRRLGLPRELARAAAGYAREDMYLRAAGDDRLVPLLEEGLAALADEDVALRVRLLARLAGALRDEPSRDRRDRLSKEAVELARATESPSALAYALDGRVPVIIAPDTVAECLALATELREVAARIGDTLRVAHGHQHECITRVIVGDAGELDASVHAMSRLTDELKQPAHLWEARAGKAVLALAAGRFTEAEELIEQALALGERVKPEMVIPVYRLQRYTLCDFRGGVEKLEPAIRELVADWPARPAFRCALAHLHARLGRRSEAQRALDDLTRGDCSALPFDQEWLYGMSLLAETAALLSDTDSAAVLYRLLVPWAAFNAADWPEAIRGSASRYLGILAATRRRWDEAGMHFEDAVAMNARMGARPWLAHTQHDYARMLLARARTHDRESARDLLNQALVTYRELGMETHAAGAVPTTRTGARA